jgi:ABC-type branched-subunit amino acid transport system substrate-binding protein
LVKVVVLVALALLAAACGARVSDEQVRSAGGGDTGVAAGHGTGQSQATGSGDAELAPGETPSGGGTTDTTTAAGGTAGSEAAAPAPAGGNGGATDVGVTADQILLGNVSTLSGPVPGLFAGAVYGAQAVVAYQNAKGGMFGRTFKLETRDDQFDTGQNRAQTIELIPKVFAFLGSFSLFDDVAVPQIKESGIPDLVVPLSQSRVDLPNNFAVAPTDLRGGPTGPFLWFKERFPQAVTAMGTVWGDVPSAKASHVRFKAAAESVGWKYVYDRGYQATETDFTADVVRMRQAGVKGVYLIATDDKTTGRLLKAMAQQGFKPEFVTANYMPTLPELAGSAADDVYSHSPFSLFAGEDSASTPEVKLFNDWYQKIRPGAKPDLFALYSWVQGRLLFDAMERVGPKLTRSSLMAELRKIDDYDGNGTIGPAGPGTKRPGICYVIGQLKAGKYQRIDPLGKGFRCDGTYFRR